jgi:hypothetical protein
MTEEQPNPANSLPHIEINGVHHEVINIRATGDIILDVKFENSRGSLQQLDNTNGIRGKSSTVKLKRASVGRALYRVRLDTLKRQSRYFEHLLGSETFKEGQAITAQFTVLKEKSINPTEADYTDLPRIEITDDDEATRMVGRETVFADLLRIIHDAEVITKPTVAYLASLAVMADRFDSLSPVARWFKGLKTFKWPATYGKAGKDGSGRMSITAEEMLRQKILIAWLLDQPMRLAQCTKELIIRGSSRWVYSEEGVGTTGEASWWDLPDDLEGELVL